MANKPDSFFLPVTRKSQILFYFKNRPFLFFQLSLILGIFFLPGVGALLVHFMLEGSILSSVEDPVEQWLQVAAFRRLMGLAIFPCSLLLSVGVSGISHCHRKLLFNESLFLREDFFLGIKKNWKGNFFYAFLLSLLHYALLFVSNIISPESIELYFFLYAFQGVFLLISLTSLPYFAFIEDRYCDGFFHKVRSTFALMFSSFRSLWPSLLLVGLPLTLLFFLDGFVYLVSFIGFLVLSVLEFFLLLGLSSWVVSCFIAEAADERIHKFNFPELYRKGLFHHE